MDNAKRLSVIIPGYNTREELWRRCVDSVRRACCLNDEIICVDDGSGMLVQEDWVRADVDDRVRLVRKENGGLSSARNLGLELAHGRYVTFVDSDDEVCPDVYTKTIAKMVATKSSVGVFGVKVVWVDERLAKTDLPDDREYGELLPDDVYDLSKRCLLNYACNKVYDVQDIRERSKTWDFRFDRDGMPNEDIMFNLECIIVGARWCSIAYSGYVYYRQGLTLLSRYKPTDKKGYENCAGVWRRYMDELNGRGIDMSPNFRNWIRHRTEISGIRLQEIEWRNIWMPASPFSLLDRWKWLRASARMPFGAALIRFFKMGFYTVIRNHMYVVPIRRWNIRRLYPNATFTHRS